MRCASTQARRRKQSLGLTSSCTYCWWSKDCLRRHARYHPHRTHRRPSTKPPNVDPDCQPRTGVTTTHTAAAASSVLSIQRRVATRKHHVGCRPDPPGVLPLLRGESSGQFRLKPPRGRQLRGRLSSCLNDNGWGRKNGKISNPSTGTIVLERSCCIEWSRCNPTPPTLSVSIFPATMSYVKRVHAVPYMTSISNILCCLHGGVAAQ